MQLSGNISYTSTGQALARKTKEAIAPKEVHRHSSEIEDTFRQASTSQETSPSEKALADFGKRISGLQNYQPDMARASYTVLASMATGSVQGPVGAALGHIVLSAASSTEFDGPKATVMEHGLATIAEHCQNTNAGQLAALGTKFHRGSDDLYVHGRHAPTLQRHFLRALAEDTDGQTGQVLAKAVRSAAAEMTEAKGPTWAVTQQGLLAIADSPTASQEEKLLASLGRSYSNVWLDTAYSTLAQLEVVNLLSEPTLGSTTDKVCDLSIKVGGFFQKDGAGRMFLEDGFEAILANPESSEAEKLLAQKGLKIAGNDQLRHVPAAEQSIEIMKSIRALD